MKQSFWRHLASTAVELILHLGTCMLCAAAFFGSSLLTSHMLGLDDIAVVMVFTAALVVFGVVLVAWVRWEI